MDGYEVVRRIRRSAEGARLFIVALTGYGSQDDRRRAFDAGFDLHLVKPADMRVLADIVAHRRAQT